MKSSPFTSKRLSFREINKSDTEHIVNWRSDPEVYRYFKNPTKITKQQHIDWFLNNYLKDENRLDFMALNSDGIRVGVFGLIINKNVAEISYIVSPDQQRKGYATEGILRLIRYALEKKNVDTILAEIHVDNLPSISLVQKLGFHKKHSSGIFIEYEYRPEKKVYIRVDGNRKIGIGHVMRCISIANAIKEKGYKPVFIMSDNSCIDIVNSYNIESIIINSDWQNLSSEYEKIQKIIKDNNIRSLLVDSYTVTHDYFINIPCHIVYLDDLANDIYDVNSIICYAAYWKKLNHKEKYSNTDLLLGPMYIPLRKEFLNNKQKVINDKIKNVLIISGSTNPDHTIEKIANRLLNDGPFNITIACGQFSTVNKKLINNKNVTIINNSNDISILMKDADLAITASGTTLYELCACGTPSISYIIANNQVENANYFNDNNIIFCAGKKDDDSLLDNISMLTKKYFSRDFRLNLSKKMQNIVDGRGAERIAEKMVEYSLEGVK